MNKSLENKSIKKHKTSNSKKLSFLSATLLVVGTSIGAGIFLKNKEILHNTQGNILLASICWIISIIAIICMGLSLTELCSGSGDSNKLGIIGWVKTFCNNFLYQGMKNFMAYLYLPINFFIMPFYAIMTIQQAFPGTAIASLQWYWVALISLLIITWFIFTSGLSRKMSNVQNWIITSVKFFPLLFAIMIGYIFIGSNGGNIPDYSYDSSNTPLFNELSPVAGMVISIPSIFFVFDGFYSTAGIQVEMKQPKKSSYSMFIGLVVVSTIDLLISVSLMITGTGSLTDLNPWLSEHGFLWILQMMQIFVAFGIFGIINGFTLYCSNFYEDLIFKKDIFLWSYFCQKLKPNSHKIGALYSYFIYLIMFIFCTLIGTFGYIDTTNYAGMDIGFAKHIPSLYSFVDLMANWTSVIVFGSIVISIIGAIINRKTKKIKTSNDKKFLISAYITSIIVMFSLIMVFIQTFTNLGLVSFYYVNHLYEKIEIANQYLIGTIMTVITLFLFLLIMFLPALFSKLKYNKNN